MSFRPRTFLLVLVLAAVVRGLLFAAGQRVPSRLLEPDSLDYHRLAVGLAEHGVFAQHGHAEIFRAPGYPVFLSVVYRLTGVSPVSAVALQVVADVLLCGLVAVAALVLASRAGDPAAPRIAIWAGMWQAVASGSAVFACRLLSDSLFAAGLFGVLWVSWRLDTQGWRGSTARDAAGVGLLLGGLVLWRAAALPFVVLLTAFLGCGTARWRRGALVLAGLGVALLPWVWRNAVRAGYVGVSSVGAVNLYRYEAAAVLASQRGVSFAEQQATVDQDLADCSSQADVARKAMERGCEIVLHSPARWLAVHVRTSLNTLLPATGDVLRTVGITVGGRGTLAVLNSQGLLAGVRHYFRGQWWAFWLTVPDASLVLLKYALVALGLVGCARSGFTRTDFLWLLTIVVFVFLPGPAAHPRFRVPVEPLLSIYAAVGACRLGDWFRAARRSGLTPALGAVEAGCS